MREKVIRVLKGILFNLERLVFELNCPVCRKAMRSWRDDPLCRECCACVMSVHPERGCRLCGNLISREQLLCGTCLFSPPPVQGFWAYGNYDEELKELIKAYKYGEVSRLATLLAALLGKGYHRMPGRPMHFDGVVIVPKYKARWKTYYPMKRVARRFCRNQGLRFISDAVIKRKDTPPQAALTGKSRLKNLRGVFTARPGIVLDGLDLLLLDDVSTTGSTVRFVADALHRAGARVWVLVIAKAR